MYVIHPKVPLFKNILFDFKIIILTWLIITPVLAWHTGRAWQMRRVTPLLRERFHVSESSFASGVRRGMQRATCHLGVKTALAIPNALQK